MSVALHALYKPTLRPQPFSHTQTQCPSQQEPEIPLEVVDNIILNQLNDTDLAIINQAVAQAAQRGNGSTAVTSTSNNQG